MNSEIRFRLVIKSSVTNAYLSCFSCLSYRSINVATGTIIIPFVFITFSHRSCNIWNNCMMIGHDEISKISSNTFSIFAGVVWWKSAVLIQIRWRAFVSINKDVCS